MPTPTSRSKILPARGLKANLDAGLVAGDLLEGELCYAKDEDALYQVEGGVLVKVGGGLQSGDNVSELVNDAGYITAAEVPADAVTSVNGQTGVVSLGIQDMDDFELNAGAVVVNTWNDGGVGGATDVSTGEVVRSSSSSFSYFISRYDANGVDVYTPQRFPNTADFLDVWYSTDGGSNWTATTYRGYESGTPDVLLMEQMPSGLVSNFVLSFTDPALVPDAPLAEGDFLKWSSSEQAFMPTQVDVGVTQIIAGDNITIEPANGIGVVTISASGGSGTCTGIVDGGDVETGIAVAPDCGGGGGEGGGIEEAPVDGNFYVRQNSTWVELSVALGALGVPTNGTVDGGIFSP